MPLTHEFGIIDTLTETSFEEYTPEKFHCISIDDVHVQVLLRPLSLVKTYFDSFDRPEYGLAYYGTTIIPPESLSTFLEIVLSAKNLKQQDDINELCKKIIQAKDEHKHMIHYGI